MINELLSGTLILLIRGYRYFFSPFFGQHCRFHPTCSAYAIEAVEQHGFVRGSVLAVRRVARCHPLNGGGFDPVPQTSVTTRSERR